MSNRGKAPLVPKLRFPEFMEAVAWTVRQVNELLFEAKRRNRTLELGPSDVLSVSGEYGCVNQIEFMGRSYAGVTVKDYHIVENGDIVYTKSPLKKNPYGIIKENKGKRGIVSTLYAVYRPFPGCSPTYLDHFFSGNYNLNAYLQPIVKKGAKNDMKVNNADVLKGDICVPELQEQQKIADCLSSLDELIAAQARKVDALKTHKKGLMQQLFPRKGETQPRLRFPEFRGSKDWEETVLGELVKIASGQVNPTELPYCDMPHIGGENIESHTGNLQGVRTARELGLISGKYLFDERHVLYSKIRPILNKVVIPDFQGICSADIYPVHPSDQRLCREYLAYLLLSDDFLEYATKHSDRSKIPKVNRDALLAYGLVIPCRTEQHRIAECLTNLDDLITAQTQELETLKTQKKGLMQQLFPSAEAVEA